MRWSVVCAGVVLAIGATTCAPKRPHPSLLVFVYDTVRRDATSPYGAPADVTPTLDRLARQGIVYENAYTHAPWTLPAHVSLFSGLLPSQHGTGVRFLRAPEQLEMLAEVLAGAGYQTRAISENPWLSSAFNVMQGFERVSLLPPRSPKGTARFAAALEEVLADRDPSRPLFLFVNVMNAHEPYRPLRNGRFVPPSTSPDDVAAALKSWKRAFCSRGDEVHTWRPLWWQMYLSGVREADDKLTTVLERLGSERRPLLTIATADHGQAFGEHRLVSHLYSVREEVLRIPLVVHGLDVRSERIAAAVGLANLRRSILEWAGVPATGVATSLPTSARDGADETVISEYFDTGQGPIAEQAAVLRLFDSWRAPCTEDDRVKGDMRALLRYPTKLVTYSRYPTELFDLQRDAGEQRDLAADHPELVRELTERLDRLREASVVDGSKSVEVPAETLERLRALGYVESD